MINRFTDYWLRVVGNPDMLGSNVVTVFWSTDGVNFRPVLTVPGLVNLSGKVGLNTAGFNLPHTHFDDVVVTGSCQQTKAVVEITTIVPEKLSLGEGYSPNPFEVTVTVSNKKDVVAKGVAVELSLPTQLSLASGLMRQEVGDLPGGMQRQVEWSVRAEHQESETQIKYALLVIGSNIDSTNIELEITVPACRSSLTGINVCQLEKGDILLETAIGASGKGFAGFMGFKWFHAAIYDGDGNIIEAPGAFPDPKDQVRSVPVQFTSFYTVAEDWIVLRVNEQSAVDRAVSFANDRADDPNGIPNALYLTIDGWRDSGNKTQALEEGKEFYCSLLVWAAFWQGGVDLDSNITNIPGVGDQVSPDDLYGSFFTGKATITQRKRGLVDPVFDRGIMLASPGDLSVIDSDGRITGVDSSQRIGVAHIPMSFYSGMLFGLDSEPEWVTVTDSGGPLTVEVHGTGVGPYTIIVQNFGNNIATQVFHWETNIGQVDTFTLPEQGDEGTILRPTLLTIQIDVKPDSAENLINVRSEGVIPVGILSTAIFDATTIDVTSVRFGPDGAREVHRKGHVEDVNGDGKPDLLAHFETSETGIAQADTQICLSGRVDGLGYILGCDSIRATDVSRNK